MHLTHGINLLELAHLVSDHVNVLLDVVKDIFNLLLYAVVTYFIAFLHTRNEGATHEYAVLLDFVVQSYACLV